MWPCQGRTSSSRTTLTNRSRSLLTAYQRKDYWGDKMVVVYSENQKLACEMLSKARELSAELNEKVTAVLIGNGKDQLSSELIIHGADKVVWPGASLSDLKAEVVSDLLCALAKEEGASLSDDRLQQGREGAGSQGIVKSWVSDAPPTQEALHEGRVHLFGEVVFSGNGVAVEVHLKTSRRDRAPKAYDPLPADVGRQGETVRKELPYGTYGSRTVKVDPMLARGRRGGREDSLLRQGVQEQRGH
ncbi:MAG: hypothetical protein MZU91_13140 [Desulfosudis oleivorans]|nr:hypothetical protein [Desulfosudis oleivorans]